MSDKELERCKKLFLELLDKAMEEDIKERKIKNESK